MTQGSTKGNRGWQRPSLAGRAARGSTRLTTVLIAALLALTLALARRAEAYVYWTNPGSGTIGRANLNGTSPNQYFLTIGGYPGPVAVDGAHLYWADFGSFTGGGTTIGRANLDGSGADPGFIAGASSPAGLALDAEHIYWTNFGGGTIGRARFDGTKVDQSFVTGADGPGGVAVSGEHVYWTNYGAEVVGGGTTIGRASLNGTGADQSFITGASSPAGLRVNDTHIFWVNDATDTIARADIDGTDVNQGFIPGANAERGLAIDAGYIYWATGGAIARVQLDGTGTDLDFIVTPGPPFGVDVDTLTGPSPRNDFTFGKVKRNKQRGAARLTVRVPGPGELELAKPERIKRAGARAFAAGRVKLVVKPKGEAKEKLNRRGKTKVKAEVTYTPDGGEPNTQTKRVRLIMRG